MSWDTIRFGDLYAEDSRNGLTKPSKVRGSGYKMINMGELFANDRIFDIPMELVPLKENEKKTAKVEEGDLLFARQSLVLEGAGKCSIVMEVSPLTVFESHIIRVRLDEAIADPMFYYYYFRSPLSPVSTIVSQCAQAGIRGSDLQELEVSFPSLAVQRKISDYLSKYDEAIENNNRQIVLLEEAVQRLYKEWFVSLCFPGHEDIEIIGGLPKGWSKGRADDFFEITIGKTPPRAEKQWFVDGTKGIAWASIADMGAAGTYIFNTSEGLTIDAVEKHNMKVVPEGTILLSFKLTLGRVSITTKPMSTNEAIAHFRIKKPEEREYVYSYLKNFEYDTLGNTSSISKAVNSKIIKAMPFIMPDNSTMIAYSKMAAPFLDAIYNKQKQNIELVESRNRLLTKLMSGEIEL